MKSLRIRFFLFLICYCFGNLCFSKLSRPLNVSYDNRALLINGQRKLVISSSIHYTRSTSAMWPDLIEKAKKGVLNAIDTSVFWNAHEPLYCQYDFSGKLNLIRFIKTIHDHGMYVILRIGPYVSAVWNYGGFPVWFHNIPGIELITNNAIYKNEMKNFTILIVEKMKSHSLFASQGGPIIVAQIENEYGNVESSYGQDGKKYMQWCVDLAISYRIGVPWIMSQESNDIRGVISTCSGYYCDQFWPGDGLPKMWTETWTTSNWGTPNSYRPTEDLAFAVARFFQYGGSLQNYYMYYDGTNFGRTFGGPNPMTSYDYNALLDELGSNSSQGLSQPPVTEVASSEEDRTVDSRCGQGGASICGAWSYMSWKDGGEIILLDNGRKVCYTKSKNFMWGNRVKEIEALALEMGIDAAIDLNFKYITVEVDAKILRNQIKGRNEDILSDNRWLVMFFQG